LTTSSETSTERPAARDRGAFQAWQFYILLAMLGATAAVIVSRHTHPLALLLLSAAVVGAGLAGVAFHRALNGFFGVGTRPPPRGERARVLLEREKALVLRSIKELEFDRQMGKVSEADYADIGGRLRARALALMQDIDRAGPEIEIEDDAAVRADRRTSPPARGVCTQCGTANDADAKFCKQCGRKMGKEA
jgi:hypothetical protein